MKESAMFGPHAASKSKKVERAALKSTAVPENVANETSEVSTDDEQDDNHFDEVVTCNLCGDRSFWVETTLPITLAIYNFLQS